MGNLRVWSSKVGLQARAPDIELVSDDTGVKVSELGIPGLSPVKVDSPPPQTIVVETVQSTTMVVGSEEAPSSEVILEDVQARVAMATGYELDELDPTLGLKRNLVSIR